MGTNMKAKLNQVGLRVNEDQNVVKDVNFQHNQGQSYSNRVNFQHIREHFKHIREHFKPKDVKLELNIDHKRVNLHTNITKLELKSNKLDKLLAKNISDMLKQNNS